MAIIQIKQSTKLHFATSQLLAGSRKDYDWCLNVCFLIPIFASILALCFSFGVCVWWLVPSALQAGATS